MLALRPGPTWDVEAPAKLNLLFEVIARRADGFHEIETLMVPVALFDRLIFRNDPTGRLTLACRWAVAPQSSASALGDVPTGPENLVIRALERLRARAGVEHGAAVELVKRIPSAAGLGGGSSDAAAALAVANVAWELHWPLERLSAVAAEIGSDVPFFLVGGPAICRGRGERIEPLRNLARLDCVIVRPPAGLATAAVYRGCRPAAEPRPIAPLVESLRRGDTARAGKLLFNRLEEPAAELSPWVERLRNEFAQLDCVGHQMSGSGSSYFGICRHARHARRVAGQLRTRGVGNVYVAPSCC